jgi:hypothetical protein
MIQNRNPSLKQGVALSGGRVGAKGNLAMLLRMIRGLVLDKEGLMIR